ncbi:MAG: CDP-alcohol phosphatidyltransferase family protein [Hyphomicrobiaceae bacterium]|nr:CDP-alcohol phosphatidyltransferase family protein [Hyphomicrobiaceae bacterium]
MGTGASALAVAGHVLTAARVASAAPILTWAGAGHGRWAAGLLAFAMLTDLADGPLARRYGKPSRAGAWFDVWADFLVVAAAFTGLALAGTIAFWPLAAVVASFVGFLATPGVDGGIYDPVGRYLGAILMAAAAGMLWSQDLLLQQWLATTAGLVCLATTCVRLGFAVRIAQPRSGASCAPPKGSRSVSPSR